MQPVHMFFGHRTADLTEGKIHLFTDPTTGADRIVAYFPKTWEKSGEKLVHSNAAGADRGVQWYNILTWTEVELAVKP